MPQSALNLNTQVVVIAAAVGAITIMATYWYHKKKKNILPVTWEPVGNVKKLFIYPLKSGRRMELQAAQCTECGFKLKPNSTPLHDRCLVVYKESNKEFKTARTYPKLVLISVIPNEENFATLTAPGMEKIRIKIPSSDETHQPDEISFFLDEKIFMIDCGNEVARWLSRYILGNPDGLRLGFHDALHRRNIKKTHQKYLKIYSKLGNEAIGLYSDLTSFLLMNQKSVDDLTNRIPEANVTINNFRPNIIVEGEKIPPYSEDDWDWIKIGEVVFRNVKPCTRCTLTTVDPETGLRSSNNEPLHTLNTYRKLSDPNQAAVEGDSPAMGINLGLECAGEINVGDTVYIGKS